MTNRIEKAPVPTAWEEPLRLWLLWLNARGLRERTVDTMRRHVGLMLRSLPDMTPSTCTSARILDWAGEQSWASETRHSYYGTFRVFLRWLDSTFPLERPRGALPRVPRSQPTPRPIPSHFILAAYNATDERIALASRIAGQAGLRCSEILSIQVDDRIDDLLGESLIVHGKGGRNRMVPLADDLNAYLNDYLFRNGITHGYVFPGQNGDGHLSAHRLNRLFRQFVPAPWTIHTLRHRFATNVFQATHDLVVVQQLLGHSSLATTQRYLAFADRELRDAVNAAA